MMKIYILALVLAVAQADKFSVKDGKNQTCLLLTLDGLVDLTLHEGSNSTVATVTPEGAAVIEDSNCTLIKLNLSKSVELWFQFTEAAESWLVTPIAKFDPHVVFPEKFNKPGEAHYNADNLDLFQKNESYTCKSEIEHTFNEEPKTIHNISVSATTKNFQIQSVKNENFVTGEICEQDRTTTASPVTTATSPVTTATSPVTTATSPVTTATSPVTTTLKPNFTQDFFCREGNITSFRLTGSYALDVSYNTTDGKQKKSYIVVPKSTVFNVSCSSNTSQTLTFEFFEGWAISYVFESEKPKTYHISNIAVKYVHDKNYFPNATDGGKTFYANFSSKNYLETSSGKYYYCRSKSSLSFDEVTLYTSEFKYEAFNENKDIDFTGSVSECPADEDSSSVVPIAVGAALAGLVVIVLVAYLIGRRRSRKAGYESV